MVLINVAQFFLLFCFMFVFHVGIMLPERGDQIACSWHVTCSSAY